MLSHGYLSVGLHAFEQNALEGAWQRNGGNEALLRALSASLHRQHVAPRLVWAGRRCCCALP